MGLAPSLEVLPNQVGIEESPVNRRNQRDAMTCILKPVDRIEQNQSSSVDRGPWRLGGNQKNPHAAGIVHGRIQKNAKEKTNSRVKEFKS